MLMPLIALTIMPMDTPIEPIDSSFVIMIADAFSAEVCDGYRGMQLIAASIDESDVLMEAADAYMIASFEEGFDPDGNARLTSEARDLVLILLHAC